MPHDPTTAEVLFTTHEELVAEIQGLKKAIEALKQPKQEPPVVNIPAPIVNVTTPTVNVPAPNITVETNQELVDSLDRLVTKLSKPIPPKEPPGPAVVELSKTDRKVMANLIDAQADLSTAIMAVVDKPQQVVKVGGGGTISAIPNYRARFDTFTVAANGTTADVYTRPCRMFSIQCKGTGAAATAWSIVLEGSNDGTNFSTLLTHNTATGDGVTLFTGPNMYPCLYFRSRLVSVTLGSATNIICWITGMS